MEDLSSSSSRGAASTRLRFRSRRNSRPRVQPSAYARWFRILDDGPIFSQDGFQPATREARGHQRRRDEFEAAWISQARRHQDPPGPVVPVYGKLGLVLTESDIGRDRILEGRRPEQRRPFSPTHPEHGDLIPLGWTRFDGLGRGAPVVRAVDWRSLWPASPL